MLKEEESINIFNSTYLVSVIHFIAMTSFLLPEVKRKDL